MSLGHLAEDAADHGVSDLEDRRDIGRGQAGRPERVHVVDDLAESAAAVEELCDKRIKRVRCGVSIGHRHTSHAPERSPLFGIAARHETSRVQRHQHLDAP